MIDRVMLLAVTVDAAHALLESCRVPRQVIVDHQPAELEIDPFACRVGRHEVIRAALVCRLPEELDLALPLPVRHAAVDQRDLSGEPESFEPPYEEIRRVPMLCEDDELFTEVLRIPEHLSEFLRIWTPGLPRTVLALLRAGRRPSAVPRPVRRG